MKSGRMRSRRRKCRRLPLKELDTFGSNDAYQWILEGRYDAYVDIRSSFDKRFTAEDGEYHQYADQLTYITYEAIPTWAFFNKDNTTFMRETLVKVLTGVPTTLQITIITLLIAGPLAFLFAIARMEKKKVASKLIAGYVSFIRGTPVILQILFLYSLLPSLLNHMIKNVQLLYKGVEKGTLDFDDIHTEFKSASARTINKIRKKTAFVFQNYNLFQNKTALQNVMEARSGVPDRERPKSIKKPLKDTGIM